MIEVYRILSRMERVHRDVSSLVGEDLGASDEIIGWHVQNKRKHG